MICAYMDDSSDPKRKRYTAVGGLLTNARNWNELELAWAVATCDLTEPFRSTDCECQHGQFKTWEKPACDRLMAKLVKIIRDCGIPAWGAIVDIDAFHSVFPGSREYDPYFLAVKYTIGVLAQTADLLHEDLLLWFEHSQATSGEVLSIYQEMKAVPGWEYAKRLREIAFLDKMSNRIQAADLIARESFKHLDNLGVRRTRKPLRALQNQLNFLHYDRPALERLRSEGGPDNLPAFTTLQNRPA
jgi:hypothetical protein